MRPWVTGASSPNGSRHASCGAPGCPWPRSRCGSGSPSPASHCGSATWSSSRLPRPPRGRRRAPNALQRRKQAEIERLAEEGRARIGRLSEREFLVAGVALYAGEGTKRDGAVKFANTDPRMIAFYCAWLRRFFEIDEARLRVRLYLHEGLDLAGSVAYWSEVTGIPPSQFQKPYRAVPDPTIRHAKHVHGCVSIDYSCSATHRSIMGLVVALLSGDVVDPG